MAPAEIQQGRMGRGPPRIEGDKSFIRSPAHNIALVFSLVAHFAVSGSLLFMVAPPLGSGGPNESIVGQRCVGSGERRRRSFFSPIFPS